MSWIDNMFDMARVAADGSRDPATKVGCVVVDEDKVVLATGRNGFPMGVKETPERWERPEKYSFVSHAEMNAIALSARTGRRLKGGTIFITHPPCSMCARLIIQAGIEGVYYLDNPTSMPAEEFRIASQMLAEAGVWRCECSASHRGITGPTAKQE